MYIRYIFNIGEIFKYYNYDNYFPKVDIEDGKLKLGQVPKVLSMKAKLIPYLQSATLINSVNLVRRSYSKSFLLSKLFHHPATAPISYPSMSTNKYPFNKEEVNLILDDLKHRNILVVYIAGLGNEEEIVELFKKKDIPLLNLEACYRNENVNLQDLYYFPSTRTSGHWTLFAHKKIENWLSQKLKEIN